MSLPKSKGNVDILSVIDASTLAGVSYALRNAYIETIAQLNRRLPALGGNQYIEELQHARKAIDTAIQLVEDSIKEWENEEDKK